MVTASSGCARYPWCRTDHATVGNDWHGVHLGRWRIGPIVADMNIGQSGDHPAVVRIELVHDSGKHRVLELDAGQARAASDVLDFFDPDAASDIGEPAEMLFRAGDTIDPEQGRETPW